MELIKLKKEDIQESLPPKIFKAKWLTQTAKTLLATLIFNYNNSNKSKENGFLVGSFVQILNAMGWYNNGYYIAKLNNAITKLEEYNLLRVVRGNKWCKGEKRKASEYHINWDVINVFKEPQNSIDNNE